MYEENKENIEKDENDKEKEKLKATKKKKEKIDLFPPLVKRPKPPEINILIDNKYIFPKVGILGNGVKPNFIGHTKPIIKIIYLNKNIFCSISQDSLIIKVWDLNNYLALCLKNIDLNFVTRDILAVNDNNIIVCGEKLILLNIENEQQTIIFQPTVGSFVEFNLLTKINENLGAASSIGGYFLLFDLNTGKKLKKIEMYKIHFICDQENKERERKKLEKNKANKKLEEKKEQEEKEEKEENEEEGKEKKAKKIPKVEKYIGSSKCLPTVNGHKGQVYTILGLNSNLYEECIISGGFDNLVKIFKTKDSDEVITLSGHEDTVINLALSESKDFLFSSSYDLTIRKWNLSECSCQEVMEFNKSIQNLLLPMTNDFLLSGGYDGRVKVWNADSINVKTYIYQHGCITTGLLLPAKKDCEKNTFVFGDHNGEIFIKQFIVGDENIKNFNKLKKKKESKKITENSSKKPNEKTGGVFKDITEENDENK